MTHEKTRECEFSTLISSVFRLNEMNILSGAVPLTLPTRIKDMKKFLKIRKNGFSKKLLKI